MNISEIKLAEWGMSLDKLGAVVEGKDDVNQCIGIIIRTVKGSDPFRPEFGCDILGYIDMPKRIAAPGLSREIAVSINLWEPRIEIKSISYVIEIGRVFFSIDWQYIGAIDGVNTALVEFDTSGSASIPVTPSILLTTENNEILTTESDEILIL